MWLASWFDSWTAQASRPRTSRHRQRSAQRRVAPAILRLERLEDRIVPSAGDLDPTFGVGGKVTTDFPGSVADFGRALAIQADGKIVVVGQTCYGNCLLDGSDFALAHYNSDGSLDDGGPLDITPADSFGSGGKVTTDFGSLFEEAVGVAIQADGKIVAVGYSLQSSTGLDFALARYNTNGSLDTTFDGDGKVTTDFAGQGPDFGLAVAIQADGKIVVAGISAQVFTSFDFALARYNSDGSLDDGGPLDITPADSFGSGGKVTTDFGGPLDEAWGLALQTDGKIVVAGRSLQTDHDFALARYHSDGNLDTTFDGDGKVTTDFGGFGDGAFSVGLQADGKIVAAGIFFPLSGGTDFALARYNSDGSLDTNSDADPLTHFDVDGKVITDFGGPSDLVFGLALQADGKIVAAGRSDQFGVDFAVARYKNDGSLDATFGGDGKVTTDFGSPDAQAWDVAIQADGKIVVAGFSDQSGTGFDFAVARYLAVAQNLIIEQIIPDVQALVASRVLNNGQGTSLLVKLQAALQLLDSGQQAAARQVLEAFVVEVEAYITAGILTPAQGQPLIDQANDAIALISSSSLAGVGEATGSLGDAASATAWLDDVFVAFWESWLAGQLWDDWLVFLIG